MPEQPLLTTSTGAVVTPQNVGLILTRYLSSFGRPPASFALSTTYTTSAPSSSPPKKRVKRVKASAATQEQQEQQSHQPPPDATFHCTLTMPPGLKIATTTSAARGFRSKSLARKDAFLHAVEALLEVGELDQDLMPMPNGKKPELIAVGKRKEEWMQRRVMENGLSSPFDSTISAETVTQRWTAFKAGIKAKLPPAPAVGSQGVPGMSDYPLITSASFWADCPPLSIKNLFPTLIDVSVDAGGSNDIRSLCLLTSRPLPVMEVNDGRLEIDLTQAELGPEKVISRARAHLIACERLKKVEEGKLDTVFGFNERVIRAQLSKPVVLDRQACKWLVVPMLRAFKVSSSGNPAKIKRKDIDWSEMESVVNALTTPFSPDDPESLSRQVVDSLASIRSEFARRSGLIAIRDDLTPESPVPDRPEMTILDHNSLSNLADGNGSTTKNVPSIVLECRPVVAARHGGYISAVVNPPPAEYLIPGVVHRYTISASTFQATSALPHIIIGLDNTLVAQQMSSELFDGKIKPDLALQALTTALASPTMEKSYERLEFLGDTLLKFLSTVDMYLDPKPGDSDEGIQVDRHLILSNRSLQVNAIAAGVPPYIRSVRPNMKDWIPSGWTLEAGKTAVVNKPDIQTLGDKIVADVAEALIGAAYLSASRSLDGALQATRNLHIPLRHLKTWSDASVSCKVATVTTIAQTPAKKRKLPGKPSTTKAEPLVAPPFESWMSAFKPAAIKVFGYEFKDPQMPKDILALTGDQRRRLAVQKYRLLGDAILEYMTVENLWDQYPELGPGHLTKMKHFRIGELSLSALCVVSGLSDRITHEPAEFTPLVKQYRKDIKKAKAKADQALAQLSKLRKGKAKTGLIDDERELKRASKEWWCEVPHVNFLGEIPESILGAILLDSGYNVPLVGQIFKTHFLPFFDTYCLNDPMEVVHPKAALLEILHQRGCRAYEIQKGGFSEDVKGEYEARVIINEQLAGKGHSISADVAVRKACDAVLERMEEEEGWFAKLCTCPPRKKANGS